MAFNMEEESSSWTSPSTLPTRAISEASICIAIEAEEECELTPLLPAQWRHAYRTTMPRNNGLRQNYGGVAYEHTEQLQPAVSTPFLICNDKFKRSTYNTLDTKYIYKSISKYTSKYYYEKTPYICDVRLFAILFLLIAGFTIATYLLIVETHIPINGFTLDIIPHDIWSNMAIPLTGVLNHTIVSNVLILHTGGESCDSPVKCSRVLKQLQQQYWTDQNPYELPYNFLVADDGQTYEVRGWDQPSGYVTDIPQNTSIVIGFLGNYTTISPNAIPLQSALSLITESVRRKKLQQNYLIYGLRNITAQDNDAEALFHEINNWPHFEKIINVF